MFGSKVSTLLLAEKNIIDFVEKNLAQERERLTGNELELDAVCHCLTGGPLDYPAVISHDFCDITTALDIYIEAFTRNTAAKLPRKFGSGLFPPTIVKNERLSKMPFRGDELSERQFINAIVQSSVKIRSHVVECMEECTLSGRLENLYVIISNIVMVRNYIWMFQQIFHVEAKSNAKVKVEYDELSELVEVISEQMLQCQMNLLTTYIIHDEISQNWSSTQSYYEGQRGSPTIQMWAYFLNAMQRDMWKIMPPQLAQRILAILLNDSLGILTARYAKIQPTAETMNQFCADIINTLGTVEELLLNVSTNLEQFCGEVDPSTSKIIYSIHMKCHCMITSLILVGAPLEVLFKTLRRGLSSCTLLEKPNRSFQLAKPLWMTVLSTLCPKYHSSIEFDNWELLTNLRLLCSQPSMNWALVYKVVVMKECHLSMIILQLFSTVVAPPVEFLLEGNGFKKCLNAGCISNQCHSFPKSVANHHVSACLVYLLAHTIPRDHLAKVYHSLLSHVTDWSVMNRTQVWTNTNRPIWFQSLIDLLLPILKTCVQGLCLSLVTRERGEEESTQFVVELLNSLTEILSIIPRGFFLICEEIDDLVPPSIYPVRNNVPIHFLVTAMYQLLNISSGIISSVEIILSSNPEGTGSSSGVNDVKDLQPLLLSTSERLCHLDDGIFDQAIHRLISQIESMMRQTQTQLEKKRSEGFWEEFLVTNDLANLKANFLLEEVEGQLTLRMVHWFLVTHGDVLQHVILSGGFSDEQIFSKQTKIRDMETTVKCIFRKPHAHSSKVTPSPTQSALQQSKSSIVPGSLKISPRTRTYHKPANIIHSFHYVHKYRTFDEIVWNFNEIIDWVSTIRNCKMGFHKTLILRQLERRPEFQSPSEGAVPAVPGLLGDPAFDRINLLVKMVNEIKALLS